MCVGEVVIIDDRKFSVLLDVMNFVLEEIKVKVVGNELLVSVKYEFEIEGYFSFCQFNWYFVLFRDVNMSLVVLWFIEEGKFFVEVERKVLLLL